MGPEKLEPQLPSLNDEIMAESQATGKSVEEIKKARKEATPAKAADKKRKAGNEKEEGNKGTKRARKA